MDDGQKDGLAENDFMDAFGYFYVCVGLYQRLLRFEFPFRLIGL